MDILTKMFQDLSIDSDMLDGNENYLVFNSLEMISASDVHAQMNKSAIADVGDFPLCHRNSSTRPRKYIPVK